MAKENREYKDTVFTDLFYSDETAEENLLSLYNALYGTNYTDTNILKKIRLEEVFFRNFRNDIAFSVEDKNIILGEHQSTVNPNMPLRNLMYIGREYEKLVPDKKRYLSTLIHIPTPEFVTFYNGKREQPDEQILYLSDAFKVETDNPKLELKVRVLNINAGHNQELLGKCPVLKEYSQFVAEARKHEGDERQLEITIRKCIADGILEKYLKRKSEEVINMLMGEYDYEMDIKVQREEAAAEANKRAAEADKRAEEAEKRANKAERDLKENEQKSKENTARHMLEMGGFDTEIIAQVTGLTMEAVEKLKKK